MTNERRDGEQDRIDEEETDHENYIYLTREMLNDCIEQLTKMRTAFDAENAIEYKECHRKLLIVLATINPHDLFTDDGLPLA